MPKLISILRKKYYLHWLQFSLLEGVHIGCVYAFVFSPDLASATKAAELPCPHTVCGHLRHLMKFCGARNRFDITLRTLSWWREFPDIHEGAVKNNHVKHKPLNALKRLQL